ncbi:MAG TPA: trimethylamine methyltransferase family protein [Candidatus Sulfotelmatobacter sp.]|nr:trimethylamine methyltransferase family protein [Candidatus Sulfotelmatobacter sp.]
MRPKLHLLEPALVDRILAEAFGLLNTVGAKVGSPEARELLGGAGATVTQDVAQIPQALVRRVLETAPREFFLYSRSGQAAVHYGADDVHFDPGSSCLNILDSETQQPRPALSCDLVRMIQVTEVLTELAAQSTAMVCNDVPSEIGDWYRLLLVLWFSEKPVITGAFSIPTLQIMLELLAANSGGAENLKRKPRAVFDVCPSPPLNWSEFAAQNMIELARASVPAEIVSMPLAGATAPVTLAGAIVQHAAECLAGITIHQLASPGAPVVWGGAPAIFDMRTGNTPMGAIETAMLNLGCAQVGKSLGLPTHGYLVASDSRELDAQAGMESGGSALLGALAGINMISGAGMLDFLACHSIEKLVLDAEAIADAQRLISGIQPRAETLALGAFAKNGLHGDFLKLQETRALFRKEQHFPSVVIDRRGDPEPRSLWDRARQRIDDVLATYQRPQIAPDIESAMLAIASRQMKGLPHLPGIELPAPSRCGVSVL